MGGRWSKPHVSTPSLHSLFDLRSAIHKGTCLVELELELCPSHDESQSQSSCEQQTASLDRLAGKPAIHKASSTKPEVHNVLHLLSGENRATATVIIYRKKFSVLDIVISHWLTRVSYLQ